MACWQSSERLVVPTPGGGPAGRAVAGATCKCCCKVQVTHPFLLVSDVCSQLSILVIIHGHSIIFQYLTGRGVREGRLGWPGVHAQLSPSAPTGLTAMAPCSSLIVTCLPRPQTPLGGAQVPWVPGPVQDLFVERVSEQRIKWAPRLGLVGMAFGAEVSTADLVRGRATQGTQIHMCCESSGFRVS